jgi:hypothetical protein
VDWSILLSLRCGFVTDRSESGVDDGEKSQRASPNVTRDQVTVNVHQQIHGKYDSPKQRFRK